MVRRDFTALCLGYQLIQPLLQSLADCCWACSITYTCELHRVCAAFASLLCTMVLMRVDSFRYHQHQPQLSNPISLLLWRLLCQSLPIFNYHEQKCTESSWCFRFVHHRSIFFLQFFPVYSNLFFPLATPGTVVELSVLQKWLCTDGRQRPARCSHTSKYGLHEKQGAAARIVLIFISTPFKS